MGNTVRTVPCIGLVVQSPPTVKVKATQGRFFREPPLVVQPHQRLRLNPRNQLIKLRQPDAALVAFGKA